jgi:hypothetical protein
LHLEGNSQHIARNSGIRISLLPRTW